MMKMIILLMFVCLVAVGQKNDPVKDLANAERAFSDASQRIGVNASFLQFLADDCVMFNPYPVNGKSLYKDRPASTNHLSWYPTFVEVAASGDFGISTGPWEIRKSKSDTPVAYGHYYSVWKKQANGEWKVILDIGGGYPKEVKKKEQERMRQYPRLAKMEKNDAARVEMVEAEESFNRLAKDDLVGAYSRFGSDDLRLYRRNRFPTEKKKESIRVSSELQRSLIYSSLAAQTASSGDLGFTYGFAVDAKNDSASYIRVWKKEKRWNVAADILVPFKQ